MLGFNIFAGCLTEDGRRHLSHNFSKRLVAFLLDVRSNDSIQASVNLIKQTLPADKGIWGLVNNAGIIGNMAISELCTKDDYLACWEVNLLGLIEMTRHCLPLIRVSRDMASAAGRLAMVTPVYTLSKFGVEAYSDILRRELYSTGVRVVLVEPGIFKTHLLNIDSDSEVLERSYSRVSDEVKSVYGDVVGRFRKRISQMPSSANVDLVVDAYIHGLTSRFPRTRYSVGLDCRLYFLLLSYLPTCFTDWFLQHKLQ
ncbi:Retinol dehydrogenase 7 [Bulinus truncatus]|nr:Retinol dehydrogenase 7 [Bulinus truncatus]